MVSKGSSLQKKGGDPVNGRWSKLIIWPDLHEGSCIRVLNVVHEDRFEVSDEKGALCLATS